MRGHSAGEPGAPGAPSDGSAAPPNPRDIRRAALGRRTVTVVGPAGIGKSRTVRLACRSGDVVAQCLQPFGSMSYRALAHAIGTSLSGSTDDVAAQVIAALGERILIVEDLHWCDAATVAVLQTLVGRAGMIVSSRNAHPLGPHPLVDEVVIRPLDRRHALRLVRRVHPDLGGPERDRLIDAAQGNPLLLTHLARGGSISPTLRAAVTDRLLACPPATLAELGKLALRGAPVDAGAVPLLAAGDISLTSRRADGAIWFVHDLFASTVLELLDPHQLDDLRRELTEEVPPVEAARIHLALGQRSEAARAAQDAAVGADPAMRADLLELAADALGPDAPPSLLLDAADAALDAHRATTARALAARAHDMEGSGDGRVRAAAGLRLARAAWLDGDAHGAADIVDQSLAAVRGTGSVEEIELVVERAFVAVRLRVGDPDIVPIADQAAADAHASGVAVARALNTAGLARSHTGADGWDAYFTEAERAALAAGDDEERLAACYWRLSAFGFYGPMTRAHEFGASLVVETRQNGPRRWYHHFLGAHIVHHTGLGEVPDTLIDECHGLVREAPTFRNRAQVDLAVAAALLDRGDTAGAVAVLEDGANWAVTAESNALLACAWCEVALATRDVEMMRRAIADLAACGAGFFGLNALAESAALHLAFAHPGAFEPPVASTVLTPVLGAVAHERAAYEHQLTGEIEAAISACARAADAWARQGMRRFARRAHLAAAEIAAASGDLGRATALVHPADGTNDVSARRGAALQREILRRRTIERLTPRETEVLLLVAQGLTSREISERLDIGVATVDSHIASSLRRLGARTRRQAASLVHG